MIARESMIATGDSELVQRSLSGDREAFGQIVSRYQSLICSLAYNATGSLGQSEDIAQETFLTAWRRLALLREQHSLRAWLCGIARNRINNTLRREGREPSRHAEPLEAIQESAAPEPLPNAQAISKEESAILWRALEHIPATYREPLILFYREHQSIETVAHHLDLSEEAVRQRLARGRKLLQEQVLAFVEGALERSNPGKTFTIAVLASLPALGSSASTAAAATTVVAGGTAGKATGGMGLFHIILSPLAVVLPHYFSYRVTVASAQSDEERAQIKSLWRRAAAVTFALFVPFAAATLWLTRNQVDRWYLPDLLATGMALIFLPALFGVVAASAKRNRAYYSRVLAEEYGGVFPKAAWEFRSETKLFGLPLVHIRIRDRFAMLRKPVRAWIAVGQWAAGGLFAFGAGAVGPISVGGISIGLLSFGGFAAGGVGLGGVAVGIWPLFGGLLVGWQAFKGCIAIGWNAAVGSFALARDFAIGHFASAAHVNDEVARQVIFSNGFFRCAEFVSRHWLWLNLLWIIPFLILWRTTRKRLP